MASKVPSVAFKNGYSMPIIGLGTWKSEPGQVTAAVKEAISVGYRHIDCAKLYLNESEVGEGIRAKIQDGTVKREDLFITSKLWPTDFEKERVIPALKGQLSNLGLSYLDLFLMHWPVAFKGGDKFFPEEADGSVAFSSVDFVDTYKILEDAVRKGLVKSIGVSNFNKRQIERILKEAEIHPAVNQVECHPHLPQKKLIEYCKSKGIVVTAYSPLGSPDRPFREDQHPILLEEPVLKTVAEKYNKTPAQILTRYHVDNGVVVIPKSVTPSRIKANIEIFDFKLSPSDLEAIDSIKTKFRYVCFNRAVSHPEYPFKDPY